MDRLIFGDNQFFGINHMSEEKARAQAIRFQADAAVMEVLDAALDEGVRSFMCTTHDRVARICDHVRARPERFRDFHFYPGMPYAHKYANAVTEDGMLGALSRFMPPSEKGAGGVARLMRGGLSLARGDVEGIATFLVDAEMKMFAGLNTPVIFLQNVLVDLLLGLGAHDAFRIFDTHVRARYGAEPGYITMNMPRLLPVLERLGIDNPIVCTNINKRVFACRAGSTPTRARSTGIVSAVLRCRCSPRAPFRRRKRSNGCAASPTSRASCSGHRPAPTSGPLARWWRDIGHLKTRA